MMRYIRVDPEAKIAEGPAGRQWVTGLSRLRSAARFKKRASAAGRKIPSSFTSWITSKRYGLGSGSHSPERSGLPSGVRGAGAARFGLPLLVRGIAGSRKLSH